MITLSQKLAMAALQIGAIKLNARDPFTWASGSRMPIYNDNRLLLGNYANRSLVTAGFVELIREEGLQAEVIAGTATAGIAPATSLADKLELPLIYIREKPKTHGLNKQIEGLLERGKKVLLIEDLISTGSSAINALQAIREAGGSISACLSIFTYGFEDATKKFEKCAARSYSLLTFQELLVIAEKEHFLSTGDKTLLENWNKNPFEWGEKQ